MAVYDCFEANMHLHQKSLNKNVDDTKLQNYRIYLFYLSLTAYYSTHNLPKCRIIDLYIEHFNSFLAERSLQFVFDMIFFKLR